MRKFIAILLCLFAVSAEASTMNVDFRGPLGLGVSELGVFSLDISPIYLTQPPHPPIADRESRLDVNYRIEFGDGSFLEGSMLFMGSRWTFWSVPISHSYNTEGTYLVNAQLRGTYWRATPTGAWTIPRVVLQNETLEVTVGELPPVPVPAGAPMLLAALSFLFVFKRKVRSTLG